MELSKTARQGLITPCLQGPLECTGEMGSRHGRATFSELLVPSQWGLGFRRWCPGYECRDMMGSDIGRAGSHEC